MSSSSAQLSNLRDYNGNLKIQTANGSNITISAIGDIPSPLPMNHVYLSPVKLPICYQLALSIGQLVETKYNIAFSSGYVVQDQMTRKEIARGPKWGRLFPLDLSAISRNKFTNAFLRKTIVI